MPLYLSMIFLGSRCCPDHLTDIGCLKEDVQVDPAALPDQDNCAISSDEVSELLEHMRTLMIIRKRPIDFDNEDHLRDEDYRRLTGK